MKVHVEVDMTPEEARAMMGLPPMQVNNAAEAEAEDPDTAGMSEEVLSVIEVLMGKRAYVPPGLQRADE